MKRNILKWGVFLAGVLGVYCILLGGVWEKLFPKLPELWVYFLNAVGFVLLVAALAGMVQFIHRKVERDEELKREESDERNVMIRGKAAENTVVLIVFVMLLVEFIFICMGDTIPAFILAAAIAVCIYVNIWLILYYQKKY